MVCFVSFNLEEYDNNTLIGFGNAIHFIRIDVFNTFILLVTPCREMN